MCLAVPLKLVEIEGYEGIVEMGGIKRRVNLSLVENPQRGDFVLVHAGFAIAVINREEAEKTLSLIREMEQHS